MSEPEASIFIADCPGQGRGVFAGRAFASGERLLAFTGKVLTHSEVRDFTHCLETGVGVFLGPSGAADDHVNHSCNPNCAVFFEAGKPVLRALVDIKQNEQLSYDYSTVMLTDPTSFVCACGSRNCRGRIGGFLELPPATRRRYLALGLVPEFVRAAARTPRRGRRRLSGEPALETA